ncbi:MFS transporter [uncultured Flavobacterium sp.]|uniref:CynX/NimT family MFS transporter n=1 Tax=uncultured Flavobacterium sp. TaxID=165435 RepID=UPI001214F05D|nr:MFS transporter [uncultured Flavobacterium sp.]THD30641.1 MAG: MFS transporter [Flavobacterium johnsoniae]
MKNKISLSLLSVIVIILIGGGLRSPITAVSPVLSEIIALLHLDNLQGSLLTSIPLIVFASCSVLVSKVAVKANIHYSIIYSLIFLIMGLYFRVYGNVPMLYIGSFLIGLGICIGNVTTPAYIKNRFPEKIGIMTGVFSAAMNLMAAFASGFSIAIGKWTNLGWKGSLGIWIIWTLLALFAVGAEAFSGKRASVKKPAAQTTKSEFNIFRSKQAWNISVFMGIQSLVYYCLVALLPIVLVDYGMQKEETGLVLLVAQLSMLPVMFLSPVIATKMKDQKWMIFGVGILMFSGISLLALFKTQYVYLAAVLIGIASGWAFSLSILFFSLKSKTMAGTIKVSGKAQSVGYLIAAFGPPVFGMLHDWDTSWKSSFYFLMLMIVIMVFFGRNAAKPRFVEEH